MPITRTCRNTTRPGAGRCAPCGRGLAGTTPNTHVDTQCPPLHAGLGSYDCGDGGRCCQRTVATGKPSVITGQLRNRDAWQRSRPDGSVPSRPPLNSFERSRSIPENPTQKRGVFCMSLRRNSSHKDADGNAIERDLFRPTFPLCASVPLWFK